MNIDIKISKTPIPYIKAIKYLEKRVEKIKSGKCSDFLWILEHPTTYTAGIRSDKSEILDNKIKIVPTKRGGKITVHNPGQKIIYFAIDLNKKKKDIRKFVKILENSIIQFLSIYNIKSVSDKKNIGIWVNGKKIAAIGLRVSRWIAYHGFSLNINNDLNEYRKIKPCGLNNKKITSIYNEKKKPINIDGEKLVSILVKNINKI